MVSKTNGRVVAGLITIMALGLWGCPAWHADSPPRVPPPTDPVPCDPARAPELEGEACAPNGETCEVECRTERAQCEVMVCEQYVWRKMSIPPPPPP